MGLKKILIKLMTIIQLCWMPSSISEETVVYYRNRQFLSLLRTVPLLSIATYIVIILGLILFWNVVSRQLLLFSAVVLFIQTTAFLVMWKHYAYNENKIEVNPIYINMTIVGISITALIYSYISLKLFISIDFYHKIALTCVTVAITSIGCWMFASLPLAGILWSLLIPGVLSFLLLQLGPDYYLISGLAIFYCIFLFGAVLITSFKYLQSLMYESEVRNQRELIKLLFDDFEENTQDWLWEIDLKGFLCHVSVQLSNITGLSKSVIKKIPFIKIIDGISSENTSVVNELEKKFSLNEGFKDIIFQAVVNGEERWLAIKAKPLLDKDDILTGWRGVTVDITELRSKELELIKVANEDSLTGVANRTSFNASLKKMFDNNDFYCCLILFNLEGFVDINELLGSDTGDEFLKKLVLRLKVIIPEDALLARIGGRTFSLILQEHSDYAAVEELVKGIQHEINVSVLMYGNEIQVKAIIGVSYAPENANSANDLIKTASIALNDAKKQDFKTVRFFTEELRERVLYKKKLMVDLTSAIINNELSVHYQPQIDLISMKLIGFEALLRWHHPVFGNISPDVFIPLAEKSQVIVSLGEWVLKQACCDAMDWPESVSVAVNVSGVQLQHSDFSQHLSKALTVSEISFHRLVLEITETAFATSNQEIITMLDSFKNQGGRIAIDDFGTGYSSFSYLHSFPLTKLKIDRSFVQLLDSVETYSKGKAIIKSIVQLGNTLGLRVLVEGIENKDQLKILKKIGCDYAQGYLFSKPLPIDQVNEFIDHYKENRLI